MLKILEWKTKNYFTILYWMWKIALEVAAQKLTLVPFVIKIHAAIYLEDFRFIVCQISQNVNAKTNSVVLKRVSYLTNFKLCFVHDKTRFCINAWSSDIPKCMYLGSHIQLRNHNKQPRIPIVVSSRSPLLRKNLNSSDVRQQLRRSVTWPVSWITRKETTTKGAPEDPTLIEHILFQMGPEKGRKSGSAPQKSGWGGPADNLATWIPNDLARISLNSDFKGGLCVNYNFRTACFKMWILVVPDQIYSRTWLKIQVLGVVKVHCD